MAAPRSQRDAAVSEWNLEPSRDEVFGPIDVAIYVTDGDGYLTYFNAAATRIWGRDPILGRDRWCGSLRLRTEAGEVQPHAECPLALSIREGRPVGGTPVYAERPDGTLAPFVPYPMPIRDGTGRVVGVANLMVEPSGRPAASPGADADALETE